MDGSFVGALVSDFYSGFARTALLAFIGFILLFGSVGFMVYHFTTTDHKKFKTQFKPTISWELKARGQSVDTVWIYQFK